MELSLPVALAIALVVGSVIGGGVRWAWGRRTHLGFAASVLSGIVGAFIGTAVAALFQEDHNAVHPVVDLVAAVLGTVLVVLVATRLTRPPDPTPEQLVADGESNTVEFKSTARRNLHTGKRDEKIELVIAKTVAALANGDGGHLVIGVQDDGTVIGLADDLPLMKCPDLDRYELWLRDYLSQMLGGAATSSLTVSFPTVCGQEVCVIRVPRSARPVYVVPGKSEGPQLWVRVGNSTRQLPLDQALAYASDRFGRRGLRARAG